MFLIGKILSIRKCTHFIAWFMFMSNARVTHPFKTHPSPYCERWHFHSYYFPAAAFSKFRCTISGRQEQRNKGLSFLFICAGCTHILAHSHTHALACALCTLVYNENVESAGISCKFFATLRQLSGMLAVIYGPCALNLPPSAVFQNSLLPFW